MLAVAVRFAGLVVAVAMVVLVLALVWVNGYRSGTGDEALR
jgi:alkyl hydroperoxide reductase subunit AhpF